MGNRRIQFIGSQEGREVLGEPGAKKRPHMPYVKIQQAEPININITQIEVSEFPTVKVYVQVTDENGEGITGLTATNFTVTEQGQDEPSPTTEQILGIEEIAGETKISVALVIDSSGSMNGGLVAAKEAAKTFVDSMSDTDQACVIDFDDDATLEQALTSDKEALKAAIDGMVDRGWTAMYDGVYLGLEQLASVTGVKALIVLTDGDDNNSFHTNTHVIDYAKTLGTPIYSIGLGSDLDPTRLQELSDNTGGRYYESPTPDDLQQLYQEIAVAIRNQYVISYTTHNSAKDERSRTITVTATVNSISASDADTFRSPFVRLWVDIVGREQIRLGREQTYWIRYGNTGNVSVEFAIVNIELSPNLDAIQVKTEENIIWDKSTNTDDALIIIISDVSAGEVRSLKITLEATSPGTLIGVFIKTATVKFLRDVMFNIFKHKCDIYLSPDAPFWEKWRTVILEGIKFTLEQYKEHPIENILTLFFGTTLRGAADYMENTYGLVQEAKNIRDLWSNVVAIGGFSTALGENFLDQLPPPDQSSEKPVEVRFSLDPNDKVGYTGFGSQHYIPLADQELLYIIYFENLETATAPAENIQITDYLDPNLDWSWLQFGETSHPASISFDETSRGIAWTFNNINLPPNVNPPEGEGYVTFTIKPKKDLPSGTQIKNMATIDFEIGYPPDPMDTPEVINTIDSQIPTSSVNSLPGSQSSTSFEVSWSGSDDENGSGIRDYTIYVSDNYGPYEPWLTNSTDTSASFAAEIGHTYEFYSIARDNVGNVEYTPSEPDATTMVTSPSREDEGKGGGCFIATAAYGSSLEPHVVILRDFRDRFLIHNKLGRIVINFYNKYSPFVADLISKHEPLRIAIRISLLPLVAFSYSMLHFGPIITVAVLGFIFGLPIFFFLFYRRKLRSCWIRISQRK